jgi:glycosyltransferase involved in cell wall biosynthesis
VSTFLFVHSDSRHLLTHRLRLIEATRELGFTPHVAAPPGPELAQVKAAGFVTHPIPLSTRNQNPVQEGETFAALIRLYRGVAPDLVHHESLKPVAYGGIAARLTGVPAVVNSLTGLGYVFVSRGRLADLRRSIVLRLLRIALRHPNQRTVVQNPEDADFLQREGLISNDRVAVIKGSGVDCSLFSPSPEPNGIPLVVLASRMLREKGVADFVEAARLLRSQGVRARFVLIGSTDDDHPGAIPTAELERWAAAGVVEWWRSRAWQEMPAIMAGSHVVCLPSRYGEGVPMTLIEAAAAGRPIVTTNSRGCREVVRDGANGFMVPIGDVKALAAALGRLLADPELRALMGQRGRQLALTEFSVERVLADTVAVYAQTWRERRRPGDARGSRSD